MKFILMMNAPANGWDFFRWTPEGREAHMAHMRRLNADLRSPGSS